MTEALGLALIHFLWQGALLAGLASIAVRTLRRPEHRYAFSCAVLLTMAAAPVVTAIALWPRGGALVEVNQAALGRITLGVPMAVSTDWSAWLCTVWALGVVAFGLRTLGGFALIEWRLRMQSWPASTDWQAKAARIAREFGLLASPRVMVSARVQIAAVFGIFRPVVILPASALTGLPAEHLEAILAHELAHVVRRDFLVNCVQCAVEALLFYHPAVWWLSNRIREERELCCDAAAARLCGDPVLYSRALLALEESRQTLVPAANGGSLQRRVERLLGRDTRSSGIAHLPVVLVAVSVLAFATWSSAGASVSGQAPTAPPAPPEAPAQPTGKRPTPPPPPPPARRTERLTEIERVKQKLRELQAEATAETERKLEQEIILQEQALRELTRELEREAVVQSRANEQQRRVRYATERFGSPDSARGRIYVQNGPPAEIESHPSDYKEIWRYHGGQEFEFRGSAYELVRFRFDGKDYEPRR